MRFVAVRPPAPTARAFSFSGRHGRHPSSAAWLVAPASGQFLRGHRAARYPPSHPGIDRPMSSRRPSAKKRYARELEIPEEACCARPRLAHASPARGQCAAPASMGDRSGLPVEEARRIQVERRAAAAQGQAESGLSGKAPPFQAHQEPAQLLADTIWDFARGVRCHAQAPGRCLRHLPEATNRAALRRPLPRNPQGARPALQAVQLRAWPLPR